MAEDQEKMPARRVETLRSRRLRWELQRLREKAGMPPEAVATELDWSKTKVWRIETGKTGVRASDVRLMLDVYGVKDPAQRDTLLTLAREARIKGWWSQHPDALSATFLSFEAEASVIRSFEVALVPGLLQTEEYTRALLGAERRNIPAEELNRHIAVRRERQALLERDPPPRLSFVIQEAVLQYAVGDSEVMRAQLRWLVEVGRRPNVTLQVLPFAAGPHAAMLGGFVVLDFAGPDTSVVYAEHITGSMLLEERDQLERYTIIFEDLRSTALSYPDSAAKITAAAEETP